MIIKKIEKPNPETGQMEVTFALSEQQVHMLMEFAINMLVSKGLVTFVDEGEGLPNQQGPDPAPGVVATPEQMELGLEEAMMDVMSKADPKDLPQA